MNVLQQIQNFLNHLGIEDPCDIWFRKTHLSSLNLIGRLGRAKNDIRPLLTEKPKNDTIYHVLRAESGIHLTLYYPNECVVVIILHSMKHTFEELDINYLYHMLSSCYYREEVHAKKIELEKMIEGIRSITASLELDDLLENILKNALEVIPAADSGILTIHDSSIDRLVNKAAVGPNENIKKVKFKVGEAIAGKVFQDGKARMYVSHQIEKAPELINDMSNTSEENLKFILSSYDFTHTKGLIAAPISVGEQRIGVILVHQNHTDGKFTEWDLHLLKGFAAQTAVAIQNAQLFSKLKRQNQYLIKRNEVHAMLTRLSLQNKGIDVIVSALDKMIGVPLQFVDFLKGEWFPKRSIQSTPFSMEEIEEQFSDRNSPFIIEVCDPICKSYYVYPIVVDRVFLGCLIAHPNGALDELGQMALEQGGTVLALELVKKQSLTEMYYKKNHGFFNELLQNRDPELLRVKGKEWGLEMDGHLSVTIFSISQWNDLQELEAEVHRLIARIKKEISPLSYLIFGFHNKATILLSLPSISEIQRVNQRFSAIIEEWKKRDGSPLCAGTGRPFQETMAISKSHDEAEKALTYISNRKDFGVLRYDELGINRLFLNQQTEEIEAFLDEIVAPLRSEKNDLEKTLFLYMASNRSPIRTAEQLHIHINTLYQRLKKIEQLLQLSFDKPEDILKMQLACHLGETFVKG